MPQIQDPMSSLEKKTKNSQKSENFTNESIKELMLLNDEIERIEARFRIQPNSPPDPGFAKVVFDWVSGRTLGEVRTKEFTGGEFVRNVRLSIDLLKQISSVTRPETAKLALQTVELMERGIVSLGGEFELKALQQRVYR